MKAKQWLEKAETRNDPIDKFGDLWIAFNGLYNRFGGHQPVKIQSLVDDKVSDELASEILANNVQEVQYLIDQPVVDMRPGGGDTTALIQRYNQAGDSVERLKALLLICYQIRCNLVHGEKSPDRERDRQLCNCACPIVKASAVLAI